MVAISKKTDKIQVHRSDEKDCKNILDFHQKYFTFSQPAYLTNAVEGQSGISIVAYQQDKAVGHLLLEPLTSRRNIGIETAALIIGIWAVDNDIIEKLIRESIMCAWESGYHVVFSFANHPRLKVTGFKNVENSYFSMDVSDYKILGMELSWNGYKKISNDLIIPKTFLPPINKLNHFSKN